MVILQIVYKNYRDKFKNQIGIVIKERESFYCKTLVGNYGYHKHDPHNTLEHYGKFKLELIYE